MKPPLLLETTPIQSVRLPEGQVFLKREDFNPQGSHKDRGVPFQIQWHLDQGAQGFVLSSSGNAAISAAAFCAFKKVPLLLFLSPQTPSEKIRAIRPFQTGLIFCQKPINFSRIAANLLNFVNLRASSDPSALIGYQTLGHEISRFQPSALFTYVSSGTSLVGLSQGLEGWNVPLFPVQNFPQCFFTQQWDQEIFPESEALPFSLGIKNSPREAELRELIHRSAGQGVVVGASMILETQQLLRSLNIETSLEGVSTVAGWRKKQQLGLNATRPLCLLTGKAVLWNQWEENLEEGVLEHYQALKPALEKLIQEKQWPISLRKQAESLLIE
ncbi:MAG: PLP-dependent lyase/thiolase [Planctomycetota bacterium]